MRNRLQPDYGSPVEVPLNVAIYVQHLLGTGHLVRMQQLAKALQQRGVATTLIQGGQPPPGDNETPQYSVVQLPPLQTLEGDFTTLVDEQGRQVDDSYKATRVMQLLDVVAHTRPDTLVIETWPFGRRQMEFEILPLLGSLCRQDKPPAVVSSIRDILQVRSPKRQQQTLLQLKAHISLVMVHGDPAFVDLSESFAETAGIPCSVSYSGYMHTGSTDSGSMQRSGNLRGNEILVSAGGGAAGNQLLEQAVTAALADHRPWRILAGSRPDPARIAALRRKVADSGGRVIVEANRTDFMALLKSCAVSISQFGYNTALDLCMAGCAAVVVPYAGDGETEQVMRAELFAKKGLIRVLPARLLTPRALIETIDSASRPEADRPLPRMDGADRAAEILINEIRQ